ncbi:hypothetical protein IWZ03DRAFT_378091 [Phyllosticta citriasiana]|uniref:Uncharacterized protein n=1 Tax=Phyllosticta citriasiana TaxID=595635 RepID=A0ABR1KK30_9PEZI
MACRLFASIIPHGTFLNTNSCNFSSPSRLSALSHISARHDVKSPAYAHYLSAEKPQTRQSQTHHHPRLNRASKCLLSSPPSKGPSPPPARKSPPPPHLPTDTPNPPQRPSPHPPRPPNPPHPRLPAIPAHPARLHHSRLLDGVSHRLHAQRRRRHVGQSVRCGGAADGRVCGAGAVLCVG